MKATIYNFKNEATKIDNEKEVRKICVQILSGDEVVKFFYKDGSREVYDSGGASRLDDIDDGSYVLSDSAQIQAWLDFIPTDNPRALYYTYSYQRADLFCRSSEDEVLDIAEPDYILLGDLPDPKPVEEGNFNNEDFSKVYNRGFADGWNSLLRELKGEEEKE